QALAGDGVRGHRQEDVDRQLVRSLDPLRAAQPLRGAAAVFVVAIRLRPESTKRRLKAVPLLANQRAVERVRDLRGEDRECLAVSVTVNGSARDCDGTEHIARGPQLGPQTRVSVVRGWTCPRTPHPGGGRQLRRS